MVMPFSLFLALRVHVSVVLHLGMHGQLVDQRAVEAEHAGRRRLLLEQLEDSEPDEEAL